ncbi:MAG: hypothetical protein KKF62_10545 [Bacteroidetes bacterium]|nr:hypothetical protein [Bacteroidota bacterium]MBU1113518.1 hypothetical protein [Bacteroidota bacterium]MBU1797032.1 hypothetical protein [Bacteroidota bacterium]
MGNLALNNGTLKKYFGILENLDVDSKKNLIIKLTKSINSKPKSKSNIKNIFGAWQDIRTAEDIIDDIEKSRFNNRVIEEL